MESSNPEPVISHATPVQVTTSSSQLVLSKYIKKKNPKVILEENNKTASM
jgi:hypothetical protein